jgi:hypothetical protein
MEQGMTRDLVDVYPVRVLRVLHSCYIDAMLDAHQERREWLSALTQDQLNWQRFMLAIAEGRLRVTYAVADDDSEAWVILSGITAAHGWLRITAINYEDAGLSLDWFRLNEEALITSALDLLMAGDK